MEAKVDARGDVALLDQIPVIVRGDLPGWEIPCAILHVEYPEPPQVPLAPSQ